VVYGDTSQLTTLQDKGLKPLCPALARASAREPGYSDFFGKAGGKFLASLNLPSTGKACLKGRTDR